MKKSLAALAYISFIIGFTGLAAHADFKEHYDLGQSYAAQYQYPSAIEEFKSALRINYLDNSARIGLINAYLALGTDRANKDKDWNKAADDFRSALFYLKYYPGQSTANNSAGVITQTEKNLETCLENAGFDFSSDNRYATAKKLRAEGNFPAAGYEFMQALGSKTLQKSSFEQTAEIMKVLGNIPKSAEFYKKAIAVAPTDLKLRLDYAKALDKIDSTEDALNEYAYVLQKASIDNKDVLYSLEKTFVKKLSGQPNNANLNANMGAILQKQGRLDEALTYYKKAESLDPSNINTRINTGTLYQQKGDYKTAIKAYESVLILYPDNVNANLYRAQCFEKLGDEKAAQEGFKKVTALDPNNEMLKTYFVDNAKKTMSPEQFVQYITTNMQDKDPAGIFYDYAIDLHKNDKLDNSIYMYYAAIKASNGKNPEMFVNLALAQAQGGKYDDALTTLSNAQKGYPNDNSIKDTLKNITAMKTDSLMSNAAAAFNNKDFKGAIKFYEQVNPPSANSMIGIASSYQELGDRDNALEYYKKALELKPVDSDIAYYIACLYGEKEDYANAKIYLQKAVAFNKNNTQAIEYLQSIEETDRANNLANMLDSAINLYDQNKYDESLAKLNEYLKSDSNNAYALYYRGMIYEAKERRNEAIADLKKAYELNKEFSICNYLIASDYDTLGKYKEAYEYYTAYANSDVQDDEYKQYAKARAEELKEHANK
jgi:tetratricopeptide (TPR) repeat protein